MTLHSQFLLFEHLLFLTLFPLEHSRFHGFKYPHIGSYLKVVRIFMIQMHEHLAALGSFLLSQLGKKALLPNQEFCVGCSPDRG